MARPTDPVAVLSVPAHVVVGKVVLIDVSASHDPNGFLTAAKLSCGDGTVINLPARPLRAQPHIWHEPGEYELVLTVVDSSKRSGMASATVHVAVESEQPPPDTDAPVISLEFDQKTGVGTVTATDADVLMNAEVSCDGGLVASGPVPLSFAIGVLPVGVHALAVAVVDGSGNVGTLVREITVEGAPWSDWAPVEGPRGEWSACTPDPAPSTDAFQYRTESRTNGTVIETRIVSQPCVYVPPDGTAEDCVLSDWSEWGPAEWGPCQVDGVQTGMQKRTRTVITPPKNGGLPCGKLEETQIVTQPCEYVPPPPPPPPTGEGSKWFDELCARPECAFAYPLRSEADLSAAGLARSGASPTRLPVIYDPDVDAMLQRIEPGAVHTEGYGSIDAQQVHAEIHTPAGVNGALICFDFMMNDEWVAYIGPRENRTWNDASALTGWKSWRVDAWDGSGNFTLKSFHKAAVQNGPVDSIGNLTMHAQAKMTICGPREMGIGSCKPAGEPTSWTDSEILFPRLDDHPSRKFWYRPNRWVRVFMFWGGVIGNGVRVGGVSPAGQIPFYLWFAEEGGTPFQTYDGSAMVNTDLKGFRTFRFEFDASAQGDQPHGMMKVWHRNLLVMHNISLDQVQALLQAPVR